jgi:hypothetical protein
MCGDEMELFHTLQQLLSAMYPYFRVILNAVIKHIETAYSDEGESVANVARMRSSCGGHLVATSNLGSAGKRPLPGP